MSNAQHSSKTVEHYTPEPIIRAARDLMGNIDLDPATTAAVNERTVHADAYYTKEDSGLGHVWDGRVFLNPPGGRGSAQRWFRHLHYCEPEAFVFVGFSLEILQTCQETMLYTLCVPSKRIKFLDENFEPQGSPTHANVIVIKHPSLTKIEKCFGWLGEIKA